MQRWRRRRDVGSISIRFDLTASTLDQMIGDGLLQPEHRFDRDRAAAAFLKLVKKLFERQQQQGAADGED